MGARMRGQMAFSGEKRLGGIGMRRTSRATWLVDVAMEPAAENAVPTLAPVLVRCRLFGCVAGGLATSRIGTTRVTFAVVDVAVALDCAFWTDEEADGREREARLAVALLAGRILRFRVRAA